MSYLFAILRSISRAGASTILLALIAFASIKTMAAVDDQTKQWEGEYRIAFDFPDDLHFAAYERAGYLWFVIANADGESLSLNDADDEQADLSVMRRYQFEQATVYAVPSGVSLRLRQQSTFRADQISYEADLIEISQEGRLVSFMDPIVGDVLHVTLVSQPIALSELVEFPDFTLLPTLRGLVLKPRDETVAIATTGSMIGVSRTMVADVEEIFGNDRDSASGAGSPISDQVFESSERKILDDTDERTVSLEPERDRAESATVSNQSRSPFLGIMPMALNEKQYRDLKLDLLAEVSSDSNAQALAARLELARLYLAMGLGAETVAQLEPVLAGRSSLSGMTTPRAVAAAGSILLGHSEPALEELSRPPFRHSSELAVWRLAAAANLQDWPTAQDNLNDAIATIFHYPEPLLSRLGPGVMQTQLKAKDFEGAERTLRRLEQLGDGDWFHAVGGNLRGRFFANIGRLEEALDWYSSATSHPGWNEKVASLFEEAILKWQLGVPLSETLATLDTQRAYWRGHPDETTMLLKSADLRVKNKEYEEALSLLERASMRQRLDGNSKGKTEIDEAMSEIMATAKSELIRSNPLDLLLLVERYDESKHDLDSVAFWMDLAEALGEDGFEDAAIRVLEERIGTSGDDGKQRGVDGLLAKLHLNRGRPDKALAITQGALPEPLTENARIIASNALLQLDDPEKAMDVLDQNQQVNEFELVSRILFESRSWRELADLSELGGNMGESLEFEADRERITRNDDGWALLRGAVARSAVGPDATSPRSNIEFEQFSASQTEILAALDNNRPEELSRRELIQEMDRHHGRVSSLIETTIQ